MDSDFAVTADGRLPTRHDEDTRERESDHTWVLVYYFTRLVKTFVDVKKLQVENMEDGTFVDVLVRVVFE